MSGNLEIENIFKSYKMEDGSELNVINNLSITIQSGEITVIIGPSGCGKTTLLNIIAGLEPQDEGTVTMDGKKITGECGMVFQSLALFKWLTVEKNIEYGLKRIKLPVGEMRERVDKILEEIGLVEFRNEYPDDLSGGMKQRVAIARALITNPSVLLMDEPFSSLDFHLRKKMQKILLDIQKKEKKTIIFVTHDIDEAIALGDKIVMLESGTGRPYHIIDVKNSCNRVEQKDIIIEMFKGMCNY